MLAAARDRIFAAPLSFCDAPRENGSSAQLTQIISML
jgi:hypothetical protein